MQSTVRLIKQLLTLSPVMFIFQAKAQLCMWRLRRSRLGQFGLEAMADTARLLLPRPSASEDVDMEEGHSPCKRGPSLTAFGHDRFIYNGKDCYGSWFHQQVLENNKEVLQDADMDTLNSLWLQVQHLFSRFVQYENGSETGINTEIGQEMGYGSSCSALTTSRCTWAAV